MTHAPSEQFGGVNKVSFREEMQRGGLTSHNELLHISCANKTCFECELKGVKRAPFIDVK